MARIRKDKKGRVLHKGESFKKTQQLYCFAYTDPFGVRRCIYASDLGELREKEKQITKITEELPSVTKITIEKNLIQRI